jgi:hypothetical protein
MERHRATRFLDPRAKSLAALCREIDHAWYHVRSPNNKTSDE